MSQSTPDTPCDLCGGRLFRGQRGLDAHIRLSHAPAAAAPASPPPIHPDPEPPPSCHLCNRIFKGQRGLNAHVRMMHNGVLPPQPPQPPAVFPDLLSELQSLRKSARIVRYVPKALRPQVALELTTVLTECVSTNSVGSWRRLLIFASRILNSSKPDAKTSCSAVLRGNLTRWQCGAPDPLPPPTKKKPCRTKASKSEEDSKSRLDKLIEEKVFAGDVTGAIRIGTSSEGLCSPSPESYVALAAKHPASSTALVLPEAPLSPNLVVNPKEVVIAIGRFKTSSSAGPDGLRPQHIKELIAPKLGEVGVRLLEALTGLINSILAGKVPDEIRPILFGANLIALRKKCGGIRPIAIGCTIRRLTAKLACRSVIDHLRPYLQPHQMGFGTPGGAEAIHRAVRIFIAAGIPGVLVKLDVENAFNSVDRSWLLEVASEHVPSLYPFVFQAYSSPSHLLHGDYTIDSEVGVQQGDPLAPALFCLAVQPTIDSLESTVNANFLDDAALCDSAEVVVEDIKKVKLQFARIGLSLNPSKCELFLVGDQNPAVVDLVSDLLPGVKIMRADNLELLGAPLTDEALPSAVAKKIASIQLLAQRLRTLQPHVALFLLKSCIAIPKMVYLLRCAPTWKVDHLLATFDQVMRDSLESILNCSIDDATWIQASLPVARAGLGIRSAQDLHVAAFLASISSTSDLVAAILGPSIPAVDPDQQDALDIWGLSSDYAPIPESKNQRDWDRPIVEKLFATALNQASSPSSVARILAGSCKESGGWLQVLPCPNLGTFLDATTIRVAAGLRLGLPLCHPHTCRHCSASVDRFGTHGLSCKSSQGRWSRHEALNASIHRAMCSAGVPATLEAKGLLRDDGKEPDGLTLVPWTRGRCLTWDATCTDTLAPSYLPLTSKSAGAAAHSAELRKHSKYTKLPNSYIFCPFAVETFGPFGKEATSLVDDLGRRLHLTTGEPRSRSFLVQRLSIDIQRGNTAAVLGSIPLSSKFDDIYNL